MIESDTEYAQKLCNVGQTCLQSCESNRAYVSMVDRIYNKIYLLHNNCVNVHFYGNDTNKYFRHNYDNIAGL